MTTIETETAQLIKKQDLEEYHQGYFNNEFYEDCFIPHYWQNPFVNFLHSHGKAGTFDYFDAAVEYFEPKTGKNITIWFETATNGEFVNFISEIDDFENSWIGKNYPDIFESNPDEIMLKLKELAFIPKDQWPKEVLENYNDRLKESKIIHAKYCTGLKVKEDEYDFFDMVKSWYLTDNTMFTRNEK